MVQPSRPDTASAATAFDYAEMGELFTRQHRKPPSAAAGQLAAGAGRAKVRSVHRNAMTYRRFATGAEAIRFAIEDLPAEGLAATVLEIGGSRFHPGEIRNLYDSAAYPLHRPASQRRAHPCGS